MKYSHAPQKYLFKWEATCANDDNIISINVIIKLSIIKLTENKDRPGVDSLYTKIIEGFDPSTVPLYIFF